MLWIATATAILIPIAGSDMAARKVARPSGKLCIAIAIAENTPILKSLVSLFLFFSMPVTIFLISCGFSYEGISLSIIAIIAIPEKKAITVYK